MQLADFIPPEPEYSLLENAVRAFVRRKTGKGKGSTDAPGLGKIKMAFRCTSGPRKGKIVSDPIKCSKPINLKKRFAFARTKQRHAPRMAFKSRKTKKTNPMSKRVAGLNKALKRK